MKRLCNPIYDYYLLIFTYFLLLLLSVLRTRGFKFVAEEPVFCTQIFSRLAFCHRFAISQINSGKTGQNREGLLKIRWLGQFTICCEGRNQQIRTCGHSCEESCLTKLISREIQFAPYCCSRHPQQADKRGLLLKTLILCRLEDGRLQQHTRGARAEEDQCADQQAAQQGKKEPVFEDITSRHR